MPPKQNPKPQTEDNTHQYIQDYLKNAQNPTNPIVPPQSPLSTTGSSPIPPPPPVIKHKSRLLLRIVAFIGLVVITLIGITGFLYYKETGAIAKLEITGSQEYKQYIESIEKINEMWLETEAQMKTEGSSEEDIKLAHRDFIEFFFST